MAKSKPTPSPVSIEVPAAPAAEVAPVVSAPEVAPAAAPEVAPPAAPELPAEVADQIISAEASPGLVVFITDEGACDTRKLAARFTPSQAAAAIVRVRTVYPNAEIVRS